MTKEASEIERLQASEAADPVALLAESFLERVRRGETPSLSEYCKRHPELAGRIRDLFPAMALLERLAPPGDTEGQVNRPQDSAVEPTLPQLGDYLLLREIGRGGMGVVCEAEQKSLGRRVALKLLPAHGIQNPLSLERFRREARAAARLHHTNIVPVFEVGQFENVSFYVMQYIEGQGLDALLVELHSRRKQAGSQGAKPPSETTSPTSTLTDSPSLASAFERQPQRYFRGIARLGAQVADALAYAHRRGILHRDIKPSNLLLDEAGIVWVTDFGLAKTDEEGLTREGDIVGTLRFMAPERFRGDGDRRSDVYGLGATLYELLTLAPAFHSPDRLQLIQQISRDDPQPLRRHDPRIPNDLETIVLKALEKEPSARYADAEALAEDLRRFLADRPIAARRTSPLEQAWRWCRRNPAVATLLTTIALILVAVALGAGLLAAQFRKERNEAVEAHGIAQSATREARLNEAKALLGEAHGIRLSRREGQRFAALAAIEKAAEIGREFGQPPDWFVPLRNEATAALALPDIFVTRQWEGRPAGETILTAAPALNVYSRCEDSRFLSVRSLADDTEISRIAGSGNVLACRFSRDGKFLAVNRAAAEKEPQSMSIWKVEASPAVQCCSVPNAHQIAFFDRSRERLAVIVGLDGSLAPFELPSGKALGSFGPVAAIPSQPIIWVHPHKPLLAIASYHHRPVVIRNFLTGAVVAQETPPWTGGSNVMWHPSGQFLCISEADGEQIRVYAFEAETGRLDYARTIPCGHGNTLVTFNESGDRLYATGWRREISLWDFWNGRLLFKTDLGRLSDELVLHSNANRLALSDVWENPTQVGVWSVADAREHREIFPAEKGSQDNGWVAVHPSGRIAAQSFATGVRLFDLATGVELASISTGNGFVGFDEAGNLYTNTFSGAFSWPIRIDSVHPDQWSVGPPRRLPFKPGNHVMSASRDGQVIVQSMYNGYGMGEHAGGWILHPNSPLPRYVAQKRNVISVSVSPDGRWVAIVENERTLVFESATGKSVVTIQTPAAHCRFTPDGRFLLTGAKPARAISVESWEPVVDLGPGAVHDCTRDSFLAVLALPGSVYRIVEVATGREIARLEDPQRRSSHAHFTHDGTQLVMQAPDGFRVWDLRRIRGELATLGLDWDFEPFSAPPASPPPVQEITVDLGELATPGKK